MNPMAALRLYWQHRQPRERRALSIMALSGVAIGAWSLFWLPGQQRLVEARQAYQEQLALARLAARAQPRQAHNVTALPPSHLHDTALAAGLVVSRFDVDTQAMHLSVSGPASVLLDWLQRMELQGVAVEALVLEVSDGGLQLSVESRLDPSPVAR